MQFSKSDYQTELPKYFLKLHQILPAKIGVKLRNGKSNGSVRG